MNVGMSATSPGGTIDVEVVIGGRAQPLYRLPGGGRVYVAAIVGEPYTLRVRNLTRHRIETVCTVDGRNSLKDEPGDPANGGMVHRDTWDVTGWRYSDEGTRQFIFGRPEHSVSATSTGSTENVGVIGFAAWRERGRHNEDFYLRGRPGGQSASYTAAAAAAPATLDALVARGGTVGTGIGDRQYDPVGHTTFTREGTPDILVLGYDTEEELERMGLIGPTLPDPFPGAGTGYEKYASRW